MLIQNLNDKKVLIKHETVIDSENSFLLYENTTEEQKLFDDFFKDILKNEEIAIQVFEIVDKTTNFGEYFCNNKIWENRENWDSWSKKFKESHEIFLYFYNPKDRKKEILNGHIDIIFDTKILFDKNKNYVEFCLIKDYYVNEADFSSTFEIEIHTDVIYNCLEKTTNMECRQILHRFNYEKMKNNLILKNDKIKKNKILK